MKQHPLTPIQRDAIRVIGKKPAGWSCFRPTGDALVRKGLATAINPPR